jgi:hypothetical protein
MCLRTHNFKTNYESEQTRRPTPWKLRKTVLYIRSSDDRVLAFYPMWSKYKVCTSSDVKPVFNVFVFFK